jgi:AraC family transcriptional regulator
MTTAMPGTRTVDSSKGVRLQPSGTTGLPLPSYCSDARARSAVDVEVARTPHVTIGRFRCPVSYEHFSDTGPISHTLVVFPRTSVWIQHEGADRFLADPSLVTIYNRGQEYRRFPVSPDGDRCDWFAVSDDWARDIAAAFEAKRGDSERPFAHHAAAATAELYLEQRALFNHALSCELSSLELEEAVLAIVTRVLASAYGDRPRRVRETTASRRRRALVDAIRQLLITEPAANLSMQEIGAAVGASPFHVCRVFRAETGRSIHEYRLELRLRLGLELLESPQPLSAMAYRLGFSSHSHFTGATRLRFGMSPTDLRRRLLAKQ